LAAVRCAVLLLDDDYVKDGEHALDEVPTTLVCAKDHEWERNEEESA
jgi:hypothetical protein